VAKNSLNVLSAKLRLSEIARQALQIFIEQKEKEEIEKELEAGYKSNRLITKLGSFSKSKMLEVDRALKISLAL
jgi:hypothetical protein